MIKLKDLVWGEIDYAEENSDNSPADENFIGDIVIMCCGGAGGGYIPPLRYWCDPPKH